MGNSAGEDVEKNVFECSGERALLLPAARHGRDGGATMCKRTNQGERSSARLIRDNGAKNRTRTTDQCNRNSGNITWKTVWKYDLQHAKKLLVAACVETDGRGMLF